MKHDAKVTTNYYFLSHIVFKFRRPSCKATSGHRAKSTTAKYIVFSRVLVLLIITFWRSFASLREKKQYNRAF